MRLSDEARKPFGKPRRATLIVELLLVLPIMLIFVFSMIEFSLVFAAREQLAAASRAGARVAAQGGSREEIRETIREILGKGRLGHACIEVVYFREEFDLDDWKHGDDDGKDDDAKDGKDEGKDDGKGDDGKHSDHRKHHNHRDKGWAKDSDDHSSNDSDMDGERRDEGDDRWEFFVERERVAVRVHVPLTHVVPDALRWAGLSLRHHKLTAWTVMNVE